MALYTLLGLAVLFALRSLMSWRKGILLMIVLAAIQDPLRKLVPGTPGWLALATAPVFIVAVFTSISSSRRWWGDFRKTYPGIGKALLLLMVLSVPAAIISATYGAGSWLLTLIGMFSYSIIFLAVIAGYHFPRHALDVRRLLAVYCGVHGLMLSGAVLEYSGMFGGWAVLGTDALGYDWIRWGDGYVVDMISGFYRSADVMGWHAAAVCMLSFVLAMTGKGQKRRFWLFMSALAVVALMLCGRRKMVYMLPVFMLALGWVYWQAGRRGKVWAMIGLILLPVGSVWVVGDWLGDESANVRYYTETSDETLDRFQVHGFGSLVDTYKQSGFFGEGLGTATPGSHHIKVERPRVWQESTSSRILVELGVPGAFGFLGVMVAIVLALWRLTMKMLRGREPMAFYAAGLMAFFLANVGSLTVSGQILADPFIAAFLGFLIGVTLSLARPKVSGVAMPAAVSTEPPMPGFPQALPR